MGHKLKSITLNGTHCLLNGYVYPSLLIRSSSYAYIHLNAKVNSGNGTALIFGTGSRTSEPWHDSYNFSLNFDTGRNYFGYYIAGSYNDYMAPFSLNTDYEIYCTGTYAAFSFNGSQYSGVQPPSYSSRMCLNGMGTGAGSSAVGNDWGDASITYTGPIEFRDSNQTISWFEPWLDDDDVPCYRYHDSSSYTDDYYYPNDPTKVTYEDEVPTITLSESEFCLSHSGGSKTVTVTSSEPWVATSTGQWLTVSPGSGVSGDTLTLTATANNEEFLREATISFQNSGGIQGNYICVDQKYTYPVQLNQLRKSYIINKMYRNGNEIYQNYSK